MTHPITVRSHTRKPREKSEAYKRTHQELREWVAANRSVYAPAKPEQEPVALPVARDPIAALAVRVMHSFFKVDRKIRERTDA